MNAGRAPSPCRRRSARETVSPTCRRSTPTPAEPGSPPPIAGSSWRCSIARSTASHRRPVGGQPRRRATVDGGEPDVVVGDEGNTVAANGWETEVPAGSSHALEAIGRRCGQALRPVAQSVGSLSAPIVVPADGNCLLEFYDYPAEHWVHLRTTNPVESTFATVRLRQRVTKGPDRGRPAWQWRSSSSSPPSNGGVPSTRPTSSLSSGPEPGSRRASWSNVPTNQEAISKSHDTPIRRS